MKIKIALRLWLPTLALLAVLVVVGAAMAVVTQRNIERSNRVMASQQDKLQDAASWQSLTSANIARVLVSVLSSDPKVEASMKAPIAATTEQINALQQRFESDATDEERTVLSQVAEARKRYIAKREQVIGLKQAGLADAAVAALDAEMRPLVDAYTAAQGLFVKLQQQRSDRVREQVGQERMRTVWGVMALMLVVVAGLSLSATLTVRAISRPLGELANAARRIGDGELDAPIDTRRHDEIGDVMRALASMRDSLRRIVGRVRESADAIQNASAEVAAGNADLSQRTEQAAAHLQQTAGAIEQLTGHVRQSADAAAQANQLAASAQAVASRGGEVVSRVVSTMDEINTSSKRIADIIGTIDGIAFQTNILALNAAVEAARAGEQGRGFAVVAGEVRSLAQRSAEAAREIKGLISTSVERVESGARLVQDAGNTMGEIVASVQRVSDIIGEVSAAAVEQSQGIGQVNSAVGSLDQMTQQNAALVEQSAAAASSLQQQAAEMAGVVSVFRLDGATAASGAPSAALAAPAAAPPTALARVVAQAKSAPPTPAARISPSLPRPEHLASATVSQARETSRQLSTTPPSPSNDEWESF